MDFRIEIKCPGEGRLFDASQAPKGLSLLDLVRKKYPEAAASEVKPDLDGFDSLVHTRTINIYLDEAKARKTELFGMTNKVEIHTYEYCLHQFVQYGVEVYEVHNKAEYRVEVIIDRSVILKAWSEAGYPIKWDPCKPST